MRRATACALPIELYAIAGFSEPTRTRRSEGGGEVVRDQEAQPLAQRLGVGAAEGCLDVPLSRRPEPGARHCDRLLEIVVDRKRGSLRSDVPSKPSQTYLKFGDHPI